MLILHRTFIRILPQSLLELFIPPRRNIQKCYLAVLFLFFILVTHGLQNAMANQNENISEQLKVKAAFVLNLARFVEWPDDEETKKINKINLCFYHQNFLGQSIESIRNKKINNKAIEIKVVKTFMITETCEVVLIPLEYIPVFLQFNEFENLQDRITITDLSSRMFYDTSLENKIIFRLKRQQKRLRFEVNKKAAEKLGISIGSELLKLGILVTDRENNNFFDGKGGN